MTTGEAPSWFIADSSCASIGEKREQAATEKKLEELRTIFPAATDAALRAELAQGGDLEAVANRLLRRDGADGAEAAAAEAAAAAAAPDRNAAVAQMQEEDTADGAAAALDAVVLDAPPGSSSRLALVQSPTSGLQRLPPNLAAFAASPDALAAQTVEQLAAGALKLTAKIARTVNELEEGVVSGAKVVTYFVVEVNQMNFTWELRRRYSQFASFHEALSEQARPPRVRQARPPTARQRARAALPCGCGVPTACDICDSTGASRHARGARPAPCAPCRRAAHTNPSPRLTRSGRSCPRCRRSSSSRRPRARAARTSPSAW